MINSGVEATPTPSFSITALKGWVAPLSLDSLQQTQNTSPLSFNQRMEMEDRMESQKRRGMSNEDLICKIHHIAFTVFFF